MKKFWSLANVTRRSRRKKGCQWVQKCGWGLKVPKQKFIFAKFFKIIKKHQSFILFIKSNFFDFLTFYVHASTNNPVQTFRNFVCLPTRLPLNEHHNICVHICKNDTLFAWGMVMLSVFHYIQWLVSSNTLTATHSYDHHCWACRYTAKCVIAMNLKKAQRRSGGRLATIQEHTWL